MARITYLGPEGTFTEAALLQMTAAGLIPDQGADALQRLPIESTPAALDAVRNDRVTVVRDREDDVPGKGGPKLAFEGLAGPFVNEEAG